LGSLGLGFDLFLGCLLLDRLFFGRLFLFLLLFVALIIEERNFLLNLLWLGLSLDDLLLLFLFNNGLSD
jgi:hypothetical protein